MGFKEWLSSLCALFLVPSVIFLLYKEVINSFGAGFLLLMIALFIILILNNEKLTSVVASFGENTSFKLSMEEIRRDVYAKANDVTKMREDVARFIVSDIAKANRYVGKNHIEIMLEGREKVRKFMTGWGYEEPMMGGKADIGKGLMRNHDLNVCFRG